MTDCPECGGTMRLSRGRYKCEDCGFTIKEGLFHVISLFGDDEADDIPEGCAACGGDYPNCTDSCPLFDD